VTGRTTRRRTTTTGSLSVDDVTRMGASVWNEFLGYPDPPVLADGRAYWRPSSLGKCMRAQILWRTGVPYSRIETPAKKADSEQRFDIGNRLEDQTRDRIRLAGLLIASGWHVTDLDLEVQGNIDIIWGGIVGPEPDRIMWWSDDYKAAVRELRRRIAEQILARGPVLITHTEVKSTSAWTIGQMAGEPPRIDYRAQAGCYRLLTTLHPEQLPMPVEIERHEVCVIAREGGRPLLLEITEADAEFARERLEELNAHWKAGTQPDCTCGVTPGIEWERKFCNYGGLDGSVCCGSDDQLERVLAASIEATQRRKATGGVQENLLNGETT
jgi:hypothetical protein